MHAYKQIKHMEKETFEDVFLVWKPSNKGCNREVPAQWGQSSGSEDVDCEKGF